LARRLRLLLTLAEANTDCVAGLPSGTMVEPQSAVMTMTGTMVEEQSGSLAQSEEKMRQGETRATPKS
jgi:hypothetical protein